MKTHVPVIFDIVLHMGTLLSVITFFKKDVATVLKAIARLDFRSPGGRLAVNILIGGLPTAVIGLILHNLIEVLFNNLLVVGMGLAITGLFLYLSKTKNGKEELSPLHCVLIGLAQGVAIIPGLSRSGLTISVGILLGVEREKAFKYSFLLSIPTILGAALFDIENLMLNQDISPLLLAGLGISALLGYLSLKALTKIYHKKDGFTMFAPYCWLLSFLVMMTILIW
jgi:undecaprenyl-diphosphatase